MPNKDAGKREKEKEKEDGRERIGREREGKGKEKRRTWVRCLNKLKKAATAQNADAGAIDQKKDKNDRSMKWLDERNDM